MGDTMKSTAPRVPAGALQTGYSAGDANNPSHRIARPAGSVNSSSVSRLHRVPHATPTLPSEKPFPGNPTGAKRLRDSRDLPSRGKPSSRGSASSPQDHAALGILTELPTSTAKDALSATYARRKELRRVAVDILGKDDRVAMCGTFRAPTADAVKIHMGEGAHFSGVAYCGNKWTCPHCAPQEAAEANTEVRGYIDKAQKAGMWPVLVTFTMQHHRGDRLKDLKHQLQDALQRVFSGATWTHYAEDHGYQGHVYTLEIRHGKAGWHPHRHYIMFFDHQLGDAEADNIRGWFSERFGRFLAAVGGYASSIYGVDVSTKADARDYLTKWAQELTRSEGKRGASRTPFQLLADYEAGDIEAGALFFEYADAIKGTHQLRWSRALKKRLDELFPDPEPEPEVETEADQDADGESIALTDAQYARIVWRRADADVIRVASRATVDELWRYLFDVVGVPPGDDPPPQEVTA